MCGYTGSPPLHSIVEYIYIYIFYLRNLLFFTLSICCPLKYQVLCVFEKYPNEGLFKIREYPHKYS